MKWGIKWAWSGRGKKLYGRGPEVWDSAIKIPYGYNWISAEIMDQVTLCETLPMKESVVILHLYTHASRRRIGPSYLHSLWCLSPENYVLKIFCDDFNPFLNISAFITLYYNYLLICTSSHSKFLFSFYPCFSMLCLLILLYHL